MGAENFYEVSSGENPKDAFERAVKDALYEHGHSGYTGSIAEKNNFTMATKEILSSSEAWKMAESLINTDYSDKWGPAGCIQLQTESKYNKYLFFGWASS